MQKSTRPRDDEAKTPPCGEMSGLLRAWSDGDRGALDRLTPIVYDELRRLARYYMKRERTGHSLQTSALVNEAYMRLVDYKGMQWKNRAHFFAVSAQLMRRILVEHARRHNLKRGGGVQHVSLEEAAVVGATGPRTWWRSMTR
jgi:RNA polymerase sigma-70 factor, ECF subfamily